MISALFVRHNSVYKSLGIDCWDKKRDAMQWAGSNPIICHPPCAQWGKLRSFAHSNAQEKIMALWCIDQIRIHGGILEHPRHSKIVEEAKLPLPGEYDQYGGYTLYIDQFNFGHKAKKETLLYICGCPKDQLPPIPIRFDRIDYVMGTWKGMKSSKKIVTKSEREHTPAGLALWMIEVAEKCKIRKEA